MYEQFIHSTKAAPRTGRRLKLLPKSIQNVFSIIDKEAVNLQKKAEEIIKELENVMKNAKTAKKNLIFYREQYDKLRESRQKELQELKSKLLEQEKLVDKKLLIKYHSKQTGRTTKIFVPLKNGRCGGCQMEIAATGLAKLDANKFLECENCGRIIYVE